MQDGEFATIYDELENMNLPIPPATQAADMGTTDIRESEKAADEARAKETIAAQSQIENHRKNQQPPTSIPQQQNAQGQRQLKETVQGEQK